MYLYLYMYTLIACLEPQSSPSSPSMFPLDRPPLPGDCWKLAPPQPVLEPWELMRVKGYVIRLTE